MKRLLLAAFVCCAIDAMAQVPASYALPFYIYSGIVGECVDTADLAPRLSIRANGGRYYIAGRSLYVDTAHRFWGEGRSGCLVRVADFDFEVLGLDKGGDPSNQYLELWSGTETYRFDLRTRGLERFSVEGLLSSFLLHPIVSATGVKGGYGCHGAGSRTSVTYEAVEVDTTLPSLRHEHRPGSVGVEGRWEVNCVDLEELTRALQSVNLDPDRVPSLAECLIPEADVTAYTERVRRQVVKWEEIQERGEDNVLWFDLDWGALPTTHSRDVYLSLASIIDSVSPEVLREALRTHRDGAESTFRRYARVTLVNEASDTLHITFSTDGMRQPFNLPWTISYDRAQFHTYSIELARLLMKLVPESERQRDVSENVQLLYVVAGYLYRVGETADR